MLRRRSLYGASGSQEVIDLSYRDIYGNDTVTRNTANCYVVRENGSYKIPLIYGNGVKNGEVNTSAYTPESSYHGNFYNHLGNIITTAYIEEMSGCTAVTPCLAWCEAQGAISNLQIVDGDDGVRELQFNVQNFPSLGANAIIGILDSNGDFIWSWHIWFYGDELKKVDFSTTDNGDCSMLNVNLGWTWDDNSKTYGKNPHFQWGRKDPMLSPASVTSTTEHDYYGEKTFGILTDNSGKTIAGAIAKPYLVFGYYDKTYYHWAASLNNNMWDSNYTGTFYSWIQKTIYDPCPVGYCMPPINSFCAVTNSSGTTDTSHNTIGDFNHGLTFKTNDSDTVGNFFPAAGNRRDVTGELSGVGVNSLYWTSALDRTYIGRAFYHSGTKVGPTWGVLRCAALSVRPYYVGL